jgi:hypothetical protein
MSEEQPPGDPKRPEAQPPGSSSQGPKPFWRRTPFLMAAPPLTLVMIITIVGFVSACTSSPASSFTPVTQSFGSAGGSPSASAGGSPSGSASPTPTMTRQTDLVVFKVTGSGYPSIQYGTDNNGNSPPGGYGPLGNGNALPWSGSLTYDSSALYYYVSAQLQGYGDISDSVTEVITTYCSNGHHKKESFPLASGHASGGYNIAMAEYTGGGTGNAQQA